ncbi:hypothetical protein EYF80_016039 [Liparis tanakae]|uniref:Uncharacterized protein n=1 Tax=Liparis tanakae TaxID=230148 RepID=A0A4Z2I6H9_9TELE|nr:hypothetical protein EYF80_016039 [Liparis tanakae]
MLGWVAGRGDSCAASPPPPHPASSKSPTRCRVGCHKALGSMLDAFRGVARFAASAVVDVYSFWFRHTCKRSNPTPPPFLPTSLIKI